MRSLDDVAAYVRRRQAEVDHALEHVLPPSPGCPAVLRDAMRYSLTAGGKRVRPILCLAAAEAVGAAEGVALRTACALELIHTYSLIHDDLPSMDDDSLRRGRPTLHIVAGEGMAILAGDGLLTEAFALLSSQTGLEPARALRTVCVVAEAAGAVGMVGGQAIDLATVTPDPSGRRLPPLDGDGVATMHAKKTGALIRASAAAGAIVGGGTDAQVAAIGSAATEFGLAFQIVDDILDVEGQAADLGKTPGKDAAAGKPTYPALYGLDESRRLAAACVTRAEATLDAAGLADSWLLAIGHWLVRRSK
ncbi:MAG TPA: farnesyl diphosphate synthase [Vicinamibacterales bacterium]